MKKLKKELTDKEKLEISHQNFKDLYDSFIEEKERWEIKLEQAKLSQKQEDDERFERLIDEVDIDKELLNYDGERTEFVRLGMNLFKIKLKGKQKQ